MKNAFSKLMLLVGLLLLPLLGQANGAYSPGRVTITTMYNNGKALSGDYNVRHNPAASSSEYISLKYYTGTNPVLQIVGQDANNVVFNCYVNPSDTRLFPVAQELIRAAGNGATIQATVDPSSSACTNVLVFQSSNKLD